MKETNEQLWAQCLATAESIVKAHEMPWTFYNFNFGSSDTKTNTSFSRQGTSSVDKKYQLPSDLSALVGKMYTGSQLNQGTTDNEQNLLNTLLQQSAAGVPGLAAVQEAEGIDPTNFSGLSGLNSITARNPYSSDYENAIGSMYDRMFAKGRSLAQSGPQNVRGGTARQGFELAELDANIGRNKFNDVRQQQDKEAGVVQNAIQMLNAIENMRRGSKLQAQGQHMAGEHTRKGESLQAASGVNAIRGANNQNVQLAGELLGSPTQTTTDNMRGKGNQATNSTSIGGSAGCCFIFLEVLNGKLPWVVRMGRDFFATPHNQAGYRWMSSWLVPLMQRRTWVKHLVNFTVVKPFILVGEWLFGGKRPFVGSLLYPYIWAWLLVWSTLGILYGKSFRQDLTPTV